MCNFDVNFFGKFFSSMCSPVILSVTATTIGVRAKSQPAHDPIIVRLVTSHHFNVIAESFYVYSIYTI